jgi:hypothetical protein
VLELVQNLTKRSLKYGLRLIQVPEYTTSDNLSIHSFLGMPFLAIPAELCLLMEFSLLERFEFISDRMRETDWRSTFPGVVGEYDHPAPQSRRFRRNVDAQYMHFSGVVAVRVFPRRGFAFVSNRLREHKNTQGDLLRRSLFEEMRSFRDLAAAAYEALPRELRREEALHCFWEVVSYL